MPLTGHQAGTEAYPYPEGMTIQKEHVKGKNQGHVRGIQGAYFLNKNFNIIFILTVSYNKKGQRGILNLHSIY